MPIAGSERHFLVQRRSRPRIRCVRAVLRGLAFSLPFLIGIGGAIAYVSGSALGPLSQSGLSNGDRGLKPRVVIAAKNFTEQTTINKNKRKNPDDFTRFKGS